MAEKRRKFTAEFREGAVRVVTETGKPVPEVAQDLEVGETTPASRVPRVTRTERATPQDMDALIARLTAENAALPLLSHSLAELALLDETSKAQAHVWLAFVAHASASEKLAAVLHDTYARLHDLVVWLIRYGQDTEEFPQHLDPDREAHTLLALADGLTVHVLAGHHSPATALATLQRHIGLLPEDRTDCDCPPAPGNRHAPVPVRPPAHGLYGVRRAPSRTELERRDKDATDGT